jgi:DnaK suppressor protein
LKTRETKGVVMSLQDSECRADSHGIPAYQAEEGEEYMCQRQQAHFRRLLNAWRRELMLEVDRTVDHMKTDSVHCPDPNDRATQESDMQLELRTRERERKLIRKIDNVLRKIDENDYGFCEICGNEIGIPRLEARPTADLCIECKTKQEAVEKLYD